jgi:hypothetical protein
MDEKNLMIAAVFVLGLLIGASRKAEAEAKAATPASAVKTADWWTYAGSWA